MVKIDTLFMAKTTEKSYPYSPYKGVPLGLMDRCPERSFANQVME